MNLNDLGEGTKEATIKQWYKKEGDLIEEVKFKPSKMFQFMIMLI
jgi:hypothetical protein